MGSLEGWTQLRKRTSEFEDTSIEISIMKQQGEKKAGKKKKSRIYKNCETTTHPHNGKYQKVKKEKETKSI